jgi:phage terminase large subunit
MNAPTNFRVKTPVVFQDLFRPRRYKIYYGGRGSGKTMNFARAIIALCHTVYPTAERGGLPLRVLCGREYMVSIADSVHFELRQAITQLGLDAWFKVTDKAIMSKVTGAIILFRGLHTNIMQIKSLGGIDLFWGEEAHSLTQDSLTYLDPTIRRSAPLGPFGQGSEMWFSFNQHEDDDPIYKFAKCERGSWEDDRFLVRSCIWSDNPYFPPELEMQRKAMELDDDKGIYEWVWGTQCRRLSSRIIYKGRFTVEAFEPPEVVERYRYGVDWGFAVDPSVAIRCWITRTGDKLDQEHLWIDHAQYGYGIEIPELPALFAGDSPDESIYKWTNTNKRPGIPDILRWPIKADSARPELISYCRGVGFNMEAAEKWPGSLEDGIAHVKGFNIHIHQRCKQLATEFRIYSYKEDPKTHEVLPVVLEKHDHGPDAVRYALDGLIQRRGRLAIWDRLGKMR